MLDYIFKKALFTKVFWKLRDAKNWYTINRGGADSSKSWSQAQHEIIELISDKYHTLVLRKVGADNDCLLYTSPSPRDRQRSRMPSSA